VRVIAAPTGCGKTMAAAAHVAGVGKTTWLCDRHEDVEATSGAIEAHEGKVGRVLSLHGHQEDGTANCLHPAVIELWQAKGYSYRAGFCKAGCCERAGDPEQCPYLASVDALEEADTIVVTKALARTKGFFSTRGNPNRDTVVIDEDPVNLLRPAVQLTKSDLEQYLATVAGFVTKFRQVNDHAAQTVAEHYGRMARWVLDQVSSSEPEAQPRPVPVPKAVLRLKTQLPKKAVSDGKKVVEHAFRQLMRRSPADTVRNVTRDLRDLERAVGRRVFATAAGVIFHVAVRVPADKRVFVLDATANPDLLRAVFAPRSVKVWCDFVIEPAGRIVQFMDFNGPREYLKKVPPKLVKVVNAIGDLHRHGTIVLISHRTCVEELAKASRHTKRIRTAYFGALRGRNDLEDSPDNIIACHIVAGSPKTTEEARRQLALAIYGDSILPFADLVTVRRGTLGRVPQVFLDGGEVREQIWEVRIKGYRDPRMQAIYDHTVTAELTHAADRARVLIHKEAVVYLVTNEPCPKLWFAEKCLAADYLDLSGGMRSDFRRNAATYEAKAMELLDGGKAVGNADVCRALGKTNAWGWRYWHAFLEKYGDALEGERKFRWKGE
jgi:hypothetical protein